MFFFFNDTATTEIYTLSLHDALPICFGEIRVLTQEAVARVNSLGACFLDGPENRLCVEVALGCRSEEHTSELQSQSNLVCRLLLEKKNIYQRFMTFIISRSGVEMRCR